MNMAYESGFRKLEYSDVTPIIKSHTMVGGSVATPNEVTDSNNTMGCMVI